MLMFGTHQMAPTNDRYTQAAAQTVVTLMENLHHNLQVEDSERT